MNLVISHDILLSLEKICKDFQANMDLKIVISVTISLKHIDLQIKKSKINLPSFRECLILTYKKD